MFQNETVWKGDQVSEITTLQEGLNTSLAYSINIESSLSLQFKLSDLV